MQNLMTSTRYRLVELFVLFVLVPVSLVLSIGIRTKIAIGLIGFMYILIVMAGVERIKIHIKKGIDWKRFWRLTFMKFVGIAVITSLYLLAMQPEDLFNVIKNDYRVWLLFLAVYAFLSVYPQELIYRTFFFKRYQDLFKNQNLFVFVNAGLFSLAHLFFQNTLVMFITFVGGLLFALTFQRTKSTFLVSIEHALYGGWLYTVGYGAMLGFPV
ncbi:CPBP family intramembrane metalloprotease [Winogradskyella maritima]|uniref:CPBP family intramembrane glutamic endopeptidase n=1 Tax=Winogradskyella maritima TaxID=1517766 RepID=A0ABV8AI58_9FLAO|nr:CPBP family intramembrane metalloprotease [Winogradskyella maritima]